MISKYKNYPNYSFFKEKTIDEEGKNIYNKSLRSRSICRKNMCSKNICRKNMCSEHIDSEYIDNEYIDSEHIDSEYIDNENIDSEHIDSEYIDNENIDSEHIDSEYIDNEHMRSEDMYIETTGSKAISDKNIPDENICNNNLNDKNIHSKKSDIRIKELNEIVERKSFTKFLEYEIPFPLKYPALKINDSITRLDNLRCTKFKSGVLVEGDIQKEIVFLTPENKHLFKYKNKQLDTHFSTMKSIATKMPFKCFNEINEMDKDYMVEIEFADVDREDVVDILSKPFSCLISGEKLYRLLKGKVIIQISIIVLKKNRMYL